MTLQVLKTIDDELLDKLTPKQREIAECLPADIGVILSETKRFDDHLNRNAIFRFKAQINERLADDGINMVRVGTVYRWVKLKKSYDDLLEEMWNVACDVVFHDVTEEEEEYKFAKKTLIENWRKILEDSNV